MSIPAAQANRYSYTGDGATVLFPYGSIFDEAADLVVLLVDNTVPTIPVVTTLVLATDYDVAGGSGANGSITTKGAHSPLTATQVIIIIGDPAIDQEFNLTPSGPIPSTGAVTAWDRAILICQRINERAGRSLHLADSFMAAFTCALPTPVASGLLGYDPTGTAIQVWPSVADIIAAAVAAMGGTPSGEVDVLLANSQAAPANVGGLIVSSAVYKSAKVEIAISRVSGTPSEAREKVCFELLYYTSTATWVIVNLQRGGDYTGVEFSVVGATGQVQYTSINIAGGANVDKLAFRLTGFTYA